MQVSDDGRVWTRIEWAQARPPVEEQLTALHPASQELILVLKPVRGLRISQMGVAPQPWGVAELRVHRQALPRSRRDRSEERERTLGP